ncbi:ACP phosphodiesterase [Erwiniaceae bacterium BAC15a-03b]|uniref:ACP phosphodiesterase n=1 Tax=Winslowiella arboricola TaxID=2978220 RepID=A0A9J6PFG1_9GAMM|nr:ACP phosphodiesterase [Winslowiella arboricola]MCU5772042.1 ACP phosphodiesterase [Winslowiella arboricola]MCU5776114.1 ACP phosphodiesterase [Winslowiella arboricola]
MNFLAHLHLASLADSSLLGNLMADFVRGNPHNEWPPAVANGIALHRRIDVMTDSLPEVRAARQFFRPETYRVAPITLDVIWDHFLARHWQQVQPEISLPAFLAQAQSVIQPELLATPERFQNLNRYLWSERWMEKYAEAHYLENVLRGMAARRPRLAALSDSYEDFIMNYHQFATLFWQFYPRMMQQAAAQQL